VQDGDEVGDVGRRDFVDAARPEEGEDTVELDAMADRRAVGNVDARGPPALGRRVRRR